MTTPREPDNTTEMSIRRSPRYLRFVGVGVIVGILIALILTSGFEASSEFTKTQVFGFLALVSVVLFGTLGALVALVFDRIGSRRASTVVAERVDVRSQEQGDDDDAAPEVPPTQL